MAIPEFVLRKLIVPGSLKQRTNGFEFILLNTFAPATITGLIIKVAGISIPGEFVKINSKVFEETTAKDISIDNPILTPIGIGIYFEILNHPLNGPVKLTVNTKEIGEFEFELPGTQGEIKCKKIKPAWTAFLRSKLKAKIKIFPDKIVGNASPFLLGQSVEHHERCVYDGIWTKDGQSLRQDTLQLIQNLHIPMIRYPGGNFASSYHWEDGIGPKDSRPCRHDTAWQAEESNQVGTDEFLDFCAQTTIEPFIVVNDGSGTPEEAARWVEYCNGDIETEQGKRRAANGHPQPYKVKYWGVGNEVWGPWQIGTASAEEYSRRLKRFTSAMKRIDPTIKIIAVGSTPLSDDPDNPATQWNKVILKNNGDEIDYLSWHIYQPDQADWKEIYDPLALHLAICAAPLDFETIIKRVAIQIEESGQKGNVSQSIDEWNVWLPPQSGSNSIHQVTFTMHDALYVAGILIVLLRNSRYVGIANLAQLVNVLPLIKTNDTKAIATSIYYPFILGAKMGSIIFSTTQESPVYDSKEISKNIQSHRSVPYLDAVATKKNDNTISLLVLNRHPENCMDLEIDIPGISLLKVLKYDTVRAYSPLSFNDFTHPQDVQIYSQKPFESKNRIVKLSPASISYLEISQ